MGFLLKEGGFHTNRALPVLTRRNPDHALIVYGWQNERLSGIWVAGRAVL